MMPDTTVATKGVLVRLCTLDRDVKRSPSSAMAYITRGIGNMEPSKLHGAGREMVSPWAWKEPWAAKSTHCSTHTQHLLSVPGSASHPDLTLH